jgi:hypothetical protein
MLAVGGGLLNAGVNCCHSTTTAKRIQCECEFSPDLKRLHNWNKYVLRYRPVIGTD